MSDYRESTMFNLQESPEGMRIVAMTEYQGKILVATEKGVYRKEGDKFVRLEFVEKIKQEQQDD